MRWPQQIGSQCRHYFFFIVHLAFRVFRYRDDQTVRFGERDIIAEDQKRDGEKRAKGDHAAEAKGLGGIVI